MPTVKGAYNGSVRALATNGTSLFAGTSGGGVYLLANNAANWAAVNSGLTNMNIYSLAVRGTNIFAGTWGGGVWRRPLSEMPTSVDQSSAGLPAQFSLSQNYPNPFNPTTTIRYDVSYAAQVRLAVYDVLGREVEVPVNGPLQPGRYEAVFDGRNLASGVCLYRLEAGSFVQTRKLCLLR